MTWGVYTKREKQVLAYIADGLATKDIALLMGRSKHTISNITTELYSKTGAKNREELYKIARLERPYVPTGDA
jgi:DNA-binding CsgD family transcriptional regulator